MTARIAVFGWADSTHVQRWMRGLQSRGFAMRLISLGGPAMPDCETIVLPRSGRWSYLTLASKAVAAAKEFRPDLIHGHYVTGFGFWTAHARFKPNVVSVWGADIIDFPNGGFKRRLIRAVLRRATHITATSAFLKDTVVSLDGCLEPKTTVIPFGVKIPAEVTCAPPTPPVRLCYIKNLKPKYGADVLLKALALVRKEFPEIRLSIAGEGEMKPQLIWEAANLGLDDIVEFVGFVPNEEIAAFLQAHHMMVMPSVMDSESFGVAAVEASAAGRAVIASRVGGVPEVVRDQETGILVPPGDVGALAKAILTLAKDAGARERMGNQGRIYACENYDWERSLDSMAELYQRLIHDHKKRK